MSYKPTIGLEIHAELDTLSKMFSPAPNTIDDLATEPNTAINAIDLAHPGTLPTINQVALQSMVRIGLAVGGKIANFTEFDRKHYFYPDIPKGYQISQYEHPIVTGGSVAGFRLTRIHLEEDTATSKHHAEYSLVDFNRAGVPLMELVTEPTLHSAGDVVRFARELQLLLRTLGVSNADIEKGQMRVEVNLSVSDSNELGTKVEIKNIGSISAAGRATEYEIARQISALENGEEIIQETRGWDDAKGKTISQRVKEGSADYRYFPDPDLPKLYLHEIFDLEKMKSELPILPDQKRELYRNNFGFSEKHIETLTQNITLGEFFDRVASQLPVPEHAQKAANFIITDVQGALKEGPTLAMPDVAEFVSLLTMYLDGEVSSRGVKDILSVLMRDGGSARDLADKLGLFQDNDEETLINVIDTAISNNPSQWQDLLAGKEALHQFFIGQVMKETRGSANPEVVGRILKKRMLME